MGMMEYSFYNWWKSTIGAPNPHPAMVNYCFPEEEEPMEIKDWIDKCNKYALNQGFWDQTPNIGEKIALMHSELSEMLEVTRREDFKPELPEFTEEAADLAIRLMDFCGWYGIDLEEAMNIKMRINETRTRMHWKRF